MARGFRDFRSWNPSGYVEEMVRNVSPRQLQVFGCTESSPGIVVIADERYVGFACRADTSFAPARRSNVRRPRSTLQDHDRLEGLHKLHIVLPPEDIALGHTRESRPGIRDHNAGARQWRQAESGRK
jgi:hypothetical protein